MMRSPSIVIPEYKLKESPGLVVKFKANIVGERLNTFVGKERLECKANVRLLSIAKRCLVKAFPPRGLNFPFAEERHKRFKHIPLIFELLAERQLHKRGDTASDSISGKLSLGRG